MANHTLTSATRRALLKKLSALSVAQAATPVAVNLLGMANAAAQTASDYKALVCVFLYGANDHYNTVVPYDTNSYNAYYAIRKGPALVNTHYEGIALTRANLAATSLTSTTGLASGLQMALGPTMTGLKSVFDAGRAGILLNVGPLIVPTTKTQYDNQSVPLPPKLFSHNDQQAYWQAGLTEGAPFGWGGRMADLMLGGNGNAAGLTCISVTGNSAFLAGKDALAYQISSSGATTVSALKYRSLFGSSACATALNTLITGSSAHLLEKEYAAVMGRALNSYSTVSGAIGSSPSADITNQFPTSATNSLSAQLKMVARLLEQRNTLGFKRQVFMVGLGGFDLHDNLASAHPGLLRAVSDALKEFNDALNFLGIANQVTTFTASDFGRTLTSNGDGSDHGWGSHHFIMGGAVNGNRFFGKAPPIGVTHTQQVGSGRLLPSTSTDQLGAELARWFGVADSDIATIFPNSKNFDLFKLDLFKK